MVMAQSRLAAFEAMNAQRYKECTYCFTHNQACILSCCGHCVCYACRYQIVVCPFCRKWCPFVSSSLNEFTQRILAASTAISFPRAQWNSDQMIIWLQWDDVRLKLSLKDPSEMIVQRRGKTGLYDLVVHPLSPLDDMALEAILRQFPTNGEHSSPIKNDAGPLSLAAGDCAYAGSSGSYSEGSVDLCVSRG